MQQFEAEAGAYLGAQAVCLSSATAGLIMTLQALDIPRGMPRRDSELQLRRHGAGRALRGLHAGLRGHREDGNVDPEDLARVLASAPTSRPRVLVHMYGLPCRTDAIDDVHPRGRGVGRGAPIPVIYDAAHAFGSARGGVRVGGGGTAEVFSTSVTKVMTSVEGGIVSSRNARARRALEEDAQLRHRVELQRALTRA